MLTAPWDARPVGKLGSRSWRGLTSGQSIGDNPVTVARPCRIFTRFRGHDRIMVWCLTDPCQQSTETGWFLDFLGTEFTLTVQVAAVTGKMHSCVTKMLQMLTLASSVNAGALSNSSKSRAC
jgi:hypothetical protein